jgi:hypothetical protein
MSEPDFYRERAVEALRRAAATDLPNVKMRHILAAETWQRFAERAAGVRAWHQEFGGRT